MAVPFVTMSGMSKKNNTFITGQFYLVQRHAAE